MVESIQHVLDRVRRPRVHITYDVEIGGAIEKKELPFVVGIIADLAAKSNVELPRIKERKFVEIDRDNFDDVMMALKPRLAFSVAKTYGSSAAPAKDTAKDAKADKAKDDKSEGKEDAKVSAAASGDVLGVELEFSSMQDFSPISVVNQVPLLAQAYQKRIALNDLVSRVDGNDTLCDRLTAMMDDPSSAGKIAGEAKGTSATETDKILSEGKALREDVDDEARARFRSLIQVYAGEVATLQERPKGDVYFFVLQRVAQLDKDISLQLDKILHHEDFQRLEGSWRGLHYLVSKSETGTRLKLRFLQITFKELAQVLMK